MSNSDKIWLIVAGALVLTGCIVFICAMSSIGWNFGRLSTVKLETKEYKISENFEDILIDTKTADIVFVKSENSECIVKCYEQENMAHSVSVSGGALSVKINDTRKWYEYIGVMVSLPKITVYLPEEQYKNLSVKTSTGMVEIPKDFGFETIEVSGSTGSVKNYASVKQGLKIKLSTGEIFVEDANVGSLDLSVTTGDIKLFDVDCKEKVSIDVSTGETEIVNLHCGSFDSDGSTGDIEMRRLIVDGKLSVKRSTGDVELEGCDAGEILIVTSTGDVEGSLLSEKVFFVDTDTGRKRVPSTSSGGRCEIRTDTGDITISIK